MTYTLFVQVVSWLESARWIDRCSVLTKGDFVTVETPEASLPGAIEPGRNSFFGEVIEVPSVAADDSVSLENRVYGVRRYDASEDAQLTRVERQFLRHRVRHTKAFTHVSDDKTHDSQAAQTFINKTIAYIEEHYVNTEKEKFFAMHMHSDNAPSHFKSSQTMNYLTKLPAHLESWSAGTGKTFRVYWEFGPPGHGKGVWDGIGAWVKRTVRQDIIDHRPPQNRSILTQSGNALSAKEVGEHLRAKFQTEEFVREHLDHTINELVVTFTSTGEITRVTTNKFSPMPGMKKTFVFQAVREEVVLQRPFACWCNACMHASAPGEGTMDTNYRVDGCASGLLWRETVIAREDAAGIANARTRTRNHARSLRDQLIRHFKQTNQPVWVAVQNRGEDEPDQYWIGRATGINKVFTEAGSVGRVRYSPGDAQIAVEWLERDISGGDERRIFKRWDGGTEQRETFNSTELRALHVSMQLVSIVGQVPLNVVQHEMRQPRRAAFDEANAAQRQQQHTNPLRANSNFVTTVIRTQRAIPPEQLWEIPPGDERRVLDMCCP